VSGAFQPYWRTNHDDSRQKNELKTLLIRTENKDSQKYFYFKERYKVFGELSWLLLEV
jgi:hypothetical protein